MDSSQTRARYNNDVISNGGYLYTGKQVYSACIATKKQTDEINALIKQFFPEPISILDMGCGDGTYTNEIFRVLKPKNITGFDIAEEAIKAARKKFKRIRFEKGDAYTMSKKFRKNQFQLGVFRGVLHHMEYPQQAIQEVSKIINSVIILEPNGFNPILKLIEKFSPYHIAHGEKSYWPPDLDRWFGGAGYTVLAKKYFSIVPYFCPAWIAQILKSIEPYFENLPFVNRLYCGGILTLYQK